MDKNDNLEFCKDNYCSVDKTYSFKIFAFGDKMHDVTLPAKSLGEVRFSADFLPIKIVPKYGNRVLILGEGCFHVNNQGKLTEMNKFPIPVGEQFHIMYANRSYRILCEPVDNSGEKYVNYFIEEGVPVTIGRDPASDILYNDSCISRRHACLYRNGYSWHFEDCNSTNGSYVNNYFVRNAELIPGDIVNICGLDFIVGTVFISIKATSSKLSINDGRVRELSRISCIDYAKPDGRKTEEFFDRPPRMFREFESKDIIIEPPPNSASGDVLSLALNAGNPLMSGGRALMTGNVFSAITSALLPLIRQGVSANDLREYEKKRKEVYGKYLEDKKEEIRKEIETEYKYLNEIYPSVSVIAENPSNRCHLFERQRKDSDFLNIRIGTGDIPMLANLKYMERRFELEEDDLKDRMYEIAENKYFVRSAPIMFSFKENFVSSIDGNRQRILPFIRDLIVNISYTHAYDELKIIVIISPDEADYLDEIRYYPALNDESAGIRLLATTSSDIQVIGEYLNDRVDELRAEYNGGKSLTRPAFLIIVLDKGLYNKSDLLKTLISEPKYFGISIVTVFDSPVKEAMKVISLGDIDVVRSYSTSVDDERFIFNQINNNDRKNLSRQIICTKLRQLAGVSEVPSSISFLGMFNVGKIEQLDIPKRWAENNTIRSIETPLGIGAGGNTIMLDLHEKHHGPHGLIAGTTGSGKSELILTYILSLALNYSPDDVSFVLIDYKGGGLSDAFVNKEKGIYLPHVAATITNLEKESIGRSLTSIEAEIKRRERIFKEEKLRLGEGTMDIYSYRKLVRSGKIAKPLPHLFIIADEFAELKTAQPEFLDALVSAARVGRSLGIHLILATQKPSGVVNDQIWSNTKFRVCMKVQSKNDSNEMLKRPEAAEIKQPGRFYLQVGMNEVFELGQSGYAGADYYPADEIISTDNSVSFVDDSGQIILTKKSDAGKAKKAESTQLVALVRYISDLAKSENITPHYLWKDELKENIDISSVVSQESVLGKRQVCIGLTDDPERQEQNPLIINLDSFNHLLLVGSAGSGKSTFFSTLLLSLIQKNSPSELHYYILDMSGGSLSVFKNAPHCGGYITEKNEADYFRLLELIRTITAERKELFASNGVNNYDAYTKIKPLPLILFVIDSYSNISAFSDPQGVNFGLPEYLQAANGCGIKFLISENHYDDIASKSKLELNYRIALRAKNKYDYNDILLVKGSPEVKDLPGRGVCSIDGRPLEWQLARYDADAQEYDRVKLFEKRLAACCYCESESTVRHLPLPDIKENYESFCVQFKPGRIPLGYRKDKMQAVSIPFKQFYCASVYFGNPDGVKDVFSNFISAARFNGAEIYVIRKTSDSIFNVKELESVGIKSAPSDSLIQTAFDEVVLERFNQVSAIANEFGRANGIEITKENRFSVAGGYVRKKIRPLIVLIESFTELSAALSDDSIKAFSVYFAKLRNYCVSFVAGFTPEDRDLQFSCKLFKFFNPDKFELFFGGCYDKESLDNEMPPSFKRISKRDPEYNNYIMRYRGEWKGMLMPCGDISARETDPDDASIL